MPRGTSVYDEAKLQGRLWTPLTLRAAEGLNGLAFFVEAFDKSTHQAASGEWTGIRDKSGRNKNMSVRTGGWTYTNNLPYLDMDGIDRGMIDDFVGDIATHFPDEATGGLVLTAAFQSGIIIFKFEATGGNGSSRIGVEGANRVDWWDDVTNSSYWGADSWSSTALKVGGFSKTATNLIARLSGKQVDSVASTDTPAEPASDNFIALGYDKNSINSGECWVSHAIMVSQSDPMTIQRIEGYAAWALRYEGNYLRAPLVGSHPCVNRPPLLGT